MPQSEPASRRAHIARPASSTIEPTNGYSLNSAPWGASARSPAIASELAGAIDRVEFALPPAESIAQNEEWVVVKTTGAPGKDGAWRRVRLHDYHEVFRVPGLYEKWVYQTLRCQSPQRIADLMARCLLREGASASDCVVLDLGAGNGCVAAELRDIGIERFVGVDLIEEAKAAAERDRPGLYSDYVVCDLTALSKVDRARLAAHTFNTLVCVAALGFGDIPPRAFATAYNLITDGGWVAFNIKTEFLAPDLGLDLDSRETPPANESPNGTPRETAPRGEPSPFAILIERMMREDVLESMVQENYPHRLNPSGEELEYTAIIGRKLRNIPEDWIEG
ncbi:MAG: class I SAM-dependent methyltransferase [Phycisphaerales bacterium]|jgi:SAM-dependent methyltransferase|nr:class I SAM-dependent methyltransferase [Phycisphaerales bacterium]